MKTIEKGIVLLTLVLVGVVGPANGQCAKLGNSFLDLTVGGPGISDYASENDLKSLPINCKFEYMFTEDMGIGVDFNYRERSNETITLESYYRKKEQVSNFMAILNFHLTKAENYDSYILLGGGYGFETSKMETNDTNYVRSKYSSQIPLAYRMAIGGRYFFTKAIGFNLEFGFGGGSLLLGGLTVKM